MSSVVPMKSLLEAGVHFGHRTRRWNPKMKPFIFTERNGIHIIDLQQTISRLNQMYELVKDNVASGGTILFVGTKRQSQESVVEEATRCGMPFVEHRWLGGTLTNWRTIRQRIDYLLEAEKQQARGEFDRLVKKEALLREREIVRLNYRLGGVKNMRRLPNYLFVVDVRRDELAVKEANVLGIPVIALVDTNCDPDPIDFSIPSNDDAIRAIRLMTSTMANAVLEGQAIHSSVQDDDLGDAEGEEEIDERYLGPSTLAKIQAAAESEAEAAAEGAEEAFAVAEAAEEVAEAAAEVADELAVEAEALAEAGDVEAAVEVVEEMAAVEAVEEAAEALEEEAIEEAVEDLVVAAVAEEVAEEAAEELAVEVAEEIVEEIVEEAATEEAAEESAEEEKK